MLPFILWSIGAGIAALFATALFTDFFKDAEDGDQLGILGMKKAGKTRFLSFIRNEPYSDKDTGKEKYEKFSYSLKNGTKIFIKEGLDIGGGEFYRDLYDNIIENSHFIFYFFNLKDYFDSILYQRECNSRFMFMFEKIKEEDKKNKRKKKIVLFGTHKDLLNISSEKASEKFNTMIRGKSYEDLENYLVIINTTDKDELKKLTEEIFI